MGCSIHMSTLTVDQVASLSAAYRLVSLSLFVRSQVGIPDVIPFQVCGAKQTSYLATRRHEEFS